MQQRTPHPSSRNARPLRDVLSGPRELSAMDRPLEREWITRSRVLAAAAALLGIALLAAAYVRYGLTRSLSTSADEAAWYKYSVTPGQIGTAVIEGHVDSNQGPAVFYRLGALQPGDTIDVTLADGITAIFRVTGVREYQKSNYPADAIYGTTNYAALRLITCGGVFDYATGHYLSSTVVFASLTSSRPAGS